MLKEITLPVLGEKIEGADVANILVHEGESIHKEDPLLELESEKAVMDFPSPVEGTIREIKIHSGDKIKIGQVLFVVDTDDGAGIIQEELPKLESGFSGEPAATEIPANVPTPASPESQRIAREFGLDIHKIPGSGHNGFITKDDVISFAKSKQIQSDAGIFSDLQHESPSLTKGEIEQNVPYDMALPDLSQWGSIRKEPMSSVRRTTAQLIAQSVRMIPHVTQFDSADITKLEKFRKNYNTNSKSNENKITITGIMIKVVAMLLRRYEFINASVDTKNESIVFRDYRHIGVAVDTERGLLVPVIRDADKKGILEISIELMEYAKKAREKKLQANEMAGATFSITNLGGFGTSYFTPVVTWPQSGVLGIGKARPEPVWDGATFIPQLVLPLSVSYDHRLIDGAYAAKFLRAIAEALEEPVNLLL